MVVVEFIGWMVFVRWVGLRGGEEVKKRERKRGREEERTKGRKESERERREGGDQAGQARKNRWIIQSKSKSKIDK